jgi:serine/threonine protein kinase
MPFANITKKPSLSFSDLISLDQLFSRPPLDRSPESRFLEEFDHVELFSKGAFGHVYVAEKKMEKKKFAVKCIKLSANDEEMAQFSTREVEVINLDQNSFHNLITSFKMCFLNRCCPD